MIRFNQPYDYRHKGRNLWFNPTDIMKLEPGECYDQCVLTLRNGEAFTIDMPLEEAAKKLNEALKEAGL